MSVILSKLESAHTVIDVRTKQPIKISEDNEILVTIPVIVPITIPEIGTEIKEIDEWTIIIDNVIPVIANSYFWYFKNNEEETLTFTRFKFHSTIDGVYSTNIHIHRVEGDPEFKNEKDIVPVKITNIDLIPEVEIKQAEKIDNLDDLGIIDKLNLHTKFKTEELNTNIEVAAGESIALMWEEPTGALSGIVTITKER